VRRALGPSFFPKSACWQFRACAVAETKTMTRKRPKSAKQTRSQKRPHSATPSGTPEAVIAGAGSLLPKRAIWIAASVVAVIVGAIGIGFLFLNGGSSTGNPPGTSVATFVGSESCAGCHRAEAELWRSSQHQLAMQHATDKTVLGDFSDASFDHYGVHSRFFRKAGKFLVETDDPDGKLATFEVKYTFGVDPLQQYLVEFPDGRLQALSIAWDNRPKEQGGQRWFHLYPDEEIKYDDVLHWTKLNQNWNFMCAECHSTGVHKNYDAANDRFATTWAEISVGCETCHGQGSAHVAWARAQQSWWPFGKSEHPAKGLLVRFDERRDIVWRRDPKTGNAARNFPPALLRKEVETCGLCHARRGEFSEDWIPGRWLSDTHVVSPLARGLYYADGQMEDEVYNYGSFKQSRMFAAGVTCGDCHDPHAAKLRAPGDGVCMQCHAAEKYATAAHHRHESVSPPLACASCHMPEHTYMVVDRRHDHSFRIPRPDLSARLGTPNACNDCHADKSAQWAASAIETWHGANRKGWQKYAEAFHSTWTDQADAAALLGVVAADPNVPSFARASALTELAPYVSPANINLARSALADPDPMVRIGALEMLANVSAAQLWPLVSPLLADSNRGVRIRAVALLAAVPTASQPPADREHFERAAAEFIAAQRLNADRPEARSALGNFYARRGLAADAEAEFKAALRLSPQYTPAAINLADLYRQLGRDGEGDGVLRAGIAASPRDAGLHHSLGLTLTRLKRPNDSLDELRRASELEPERARYAYVYAVALHSAGRSGDAIEALKKNLARHPNDRDTLLALIAFNRDAGDIVSALGYAEQLNSLTPDDINLTRLIQDLRNKAKPNVR
jgi:predicted CXXCH cytochrome family protein